ncbi:MAG: hypothetical protein AAGF99_12415, partial [Bacteroidota bacterium]
SNALRNSGLALALGFSFVACDSVTESTPIIAATPTLAEASATGDIVAASNPGGAADDDGILIRKTLNSIRFATDLEVQYMNETGEPAPEGSSIQTIKVTDDRQVVFATVDRGNGKGALGRTERMRRTVSMFTGNGQLVAPKGFDVVEEFGVVVVADFGGSAIKVFGIDPTPQGLLPLLFTIDDLGGESSVWDVVHDPTNDRLYVAGTAGTVLVYDDFAATGPQAPTRMFTPAMGGEKISVNLHGIDYDLATDQLLLTDVGSAASPSDGQIFTIENASTAMGLTEVKWVVGGDQTILGNPVDAVLSNGAAYVAEKSNDAVLKYDNVFDRMGSANVAADASITVIKAESVDAVR